MFDILKRLFGRAKSEAEQLPVPTDEDRALYRMMDAVPKQLGFELNNLKLIEMQMRHCAFELSCTDAAEGMLGIEPPYRTPENQAAMENAIKRIRAGETLRCDSVLPATALGVFWGWFIVSEFNWGWRAVSQNGWETLAVCDPDNRYLILPVQYMRGIAKGSDEVTKWPHQYQQDIRDGKLPPSSNGKLLRIC